MYMNPQVVSSDADCFECVLSMLETLNQVCADELEANGHNAECAGMLITVMNTAGELMEHNQGLHEQMMTRFGGQVNLTIVGDDIEEGDTLE